MIGMIGIGVKMTNTKNECIYLMGGSCCNIEIESSDVLVKKIQESVSGVENGYKKFYFEVQHIYNESKLFPELYPKIYEIDSSNDKYSVKFEFCFQGKTLADILRNETYDEEYFEKSLEVILDKLFHDYYSIPRESKPSPNYIIQCYMERIEKRLHVVTAKQFRNKYQCSETLVKMIRYGVYINDQYYPSILEYTGYLRKDKELQSKLMITHNTYSHHDLIPANIVVGTDSPEHITAFRLIDPRGEGETGTDVRNFMYDMGKILVGVDTLDIFRIFNGNIAEKLYSLECLDHDDDMLRFHFGFHTGHPIVRKYMSAANSFFDIMQRNGYYCDFVGETPEQLYMKYLFSFANMFHPDIPCRIIFEREESIPIAMYLRGMMVYRAFMDQYYGMDPLRLPGNKEAVELWPDSNNSIDRQ